MHLRQRFDRPLVRKERVNQENRYSSRPAVFILPAHSHSHTPEHMPMISVLGRIESFKLAWPRTKGKAGRGRKMKENRGGEKGGS